MHLPFEHVVVLDFEATCQPGAAPVPQEVIEFPSVLVSLAERRVIDSFEAFVRPVHHPTLTAFCTELTSITQAEVDAAAPFPEALARHQAWLAGHGLLAREGAFAFVTCGDWDLATLFPGQCAAAGIDLVKLPRAYRRWINVKEVFKASGRRAKTLGMVSMLASLGLELEGRHHRGIDDCRNIARIVLALAALGGKFDITARLPSSQYPELPLELRWQGRSESVVLRRRGLATLLGLASGAFHSKMTQAFVADGPPLDDDALCELAPGTIVRMVAAKDEA